MEFSLGFFAGLVVTLATVLVGLGFYVHTMQVVTRKLVEGTQRMKAAWGMAQGTMDAIDVATKKLAAATLELREERRSNEELFDRLVEVATKVREAAQPFAGEEHSPGEATGESPKPERNRS